MSQEMQELPEDAFGLVELPAGASLLEQDAILKMNAGAMLTFAVWSLPKDVVSELFKNAPQAFVTAYGAAREAYGISGN
jgi:hypothetical protein